MKLRVLALFVLVVMVGGLAISNAISSSAQASINGGTLTKTASGLIASDPLNQNLSQAQLAASSYWFFGGDAVEENAPYSFYENSSGLGVGVQAPSMGTYAGYFALSPNTNFALLHAKLTAPFRTIPSGYFETGMYIQTYNGLINYVTCTSGTGSSGTRWYVVSALGNTNQANQYDVLWESPSNLSLTQDCTMITNGQNYLKVFLNGTLVFESTTLNLQIPAPFQVYLEPETSYSGAELFSTFQNYYITSGEYLTVNGLPTNAAQVRLVNSSGVLASAQVSNGSARVEVANYLFPLNATIQVLDSSGNVIASTHPVGIYGGDTYAYESSSTSTSQTSSTSTTTTNSTSSSTTTNTSSTTTSSTTTTSTTTSSSSSGFYSLTVKTQDMSGTPIYGYYTVEWFNGQIIATAYSTATFTLKAGQEYVVSVDGYQNYVFDHWLDTGSTDSHRTVSLSSNETLTAVYRNLDSPPPANETVLNVQTMSTSGQTIDGIYTFVSQNGQMIQTFYSPAQYILPSGTYTITVDNYGPCTFQKWSDGSTARTRSITLSGGTLSLTAVYTVS